MNPQLMALMQQAGIFIEGAQDFQAERPTLRLAADGALACDAQPVLVTTSNSGIPAFLSTFIDPKLIDVLVSPMKATEIVGEEVKKGDWTTTTATFQVVESTGQIAAYGDYSENGRAGTNFNFPQRQSYHYQVMTEWGEKELARAGLARIDYANRVSMASVLTLNKFQNKSYFYGVAGLQNYGLLNDSALPATISPATKAAGGTSWTNATALEVYADIQALFTNLQTRAKGLVELDTRMTLAMSPIAEVALTKVTTYNVSVSDMLKKNFPNMVVKTAPEYTTGGGELVQLIADEIEGQRTAITAFTEKLRAHPIIVAASSFKQKRSQGTWGTVIFRPFLISGMLGV